MAQLDSNLLQRIASPVSDYQNIVAGDQAIAMNKQAMVQNQFNMDNQKKEQQRAEAAQRAATVANVLNTAKGNPQRWNQAVSYLKAQGIEFDPGEDDMNNADFTINQMMSVADQIKNGIELEKLELGGFNAQTSRMTAETNRMNATTGGAGQKPPSGYRYTPDGAALEPIKGGPADPAKPVPVRSLRPTTDQNNAAGFYDRMNEADAILSLEDSTAAATDMGQVARSNVPLGLGNYLVSEGYQKFDQARRDFINAQLRKESGAAISPGEFDSANKQYFPQPGDSDAVIKQKANNRKTAIAAMKRTAAGALQQQGEQPQAQPPVAPQEMGGGGQTDFPIEAIEILASDPSPEARAEFDAIFGEGASGLVLEGQ